MTRLVTHTALMLTLAAAPAGAQTVEEIVARHIAARGGYERIKAVQTYTFTREVGTPFSVVRVTIYKKRPALYRGEQTMPAGQTTVRIVNPEGAFLVAGDTVTPQPEPVAMEQREVDGDFDGILVDYKEKGHTVSLEGREKLPGYDTYKLKVTLKSGAVRHIWIDAATFLERKHQYEMTNPQGQKVRAEMLFDDYRDVDGLKIPFAIDEDRDAMGQTFAIYQKAVEIDVPLDDALFRAPSAVSVPTPREPAAPRAPASTARGRAR